MKRFVVHIIFLCCVAVTLLTGCKKEPVRVSSITLSKTSLELIEGESATITATVLPEDAENKTVVWASSNSNIASVTNGKIQALTPGKTTITATADGKSATCSVLVNAKIIPVESIVLNKTISWRKICNLLCCGQR